MLPTPITVANDQVYEPAEDSFFLLDSLELDIDYLQQLAAPVVVEVGSGSGIVSTFLHSFIPTGTHLATDINPAALITTEKTWRKNNKIKADDIEVIRASLTPLRPNVVDVLIFNPPYVPTEVVPDMPLQDDDSRWLDLALDGGPGGMEVTDRLLDLLQYILSPEGAAYILFCASNKPKEVAQRMIDKGWHVKDLGTRKAGWEILTVLRFKREAAA